MDRLEFVLVGCTRMVLKHSGFQRPCRRQKDAVIIIRSVQYNAMVVNSRRKQPINRR